MPRINEYKCSKCGFELWMGWGYGFYVEDDKGERIPCPHPAEHHIVEQVLGKNPSPELVNQRTGFHSHCVCLDCLHQFKADLGNLGYYTYYISVNFRENKQIYKWEAKDKRECPKCKSKNVKTTREMVGQMCPKCRKRIIEQIPTSMIT